MKKFKKIYIEISNICNLQCSFCPEVLREKKVMRVEEFEKIVSEAGPLTEELCLHLMGEPMGHPHLGEILELCSVYKLPIYFVTNGTLLNNPQKYKHLFHKSIRQINFSLHSFAANFPEKDIAPYLENIFRFTEEARNLRPDLYINYRLWNLEKIDQSQKESNEKIFLAVQEKFQKKINPMVDVKRKKGFPLTEKVYIHFDTEFSWPNINSPHRSDTGFCYGLDTHIGIHANGSVVPCCLDKEAVINLGNIHEQPLAEILQGSRAQKMKTGFQKHELVEDLCKRCQYIGRFDKKTQRKTAAAPHNSES